MEPCNDNLVRAAAEAIRILERMRVLKGKHATARQIVALRERRAEKEEMVLTAEFLEGEKKVSAAAAKIKALSSPKYAAALRKVMKETAEAQAILDEWEILKLQYDECSATRNDERAKMKLL